MRKSDGQDRRRLEGLGGLNAYQIAGLAIAVSSVVAAAVLLAVRRLIGRDQGAEPELSIGQPPIGPETSAEMPHHFSEELIVPGFTETGSEISEQDATDGHAPEGV